MSGATNNLVPHLRSTDKVILFDGVCKLCNGWSNFIIHHDKGLQFKLASVQSDEGQAILKYFNYPLVNFETMLVLENNYALTKSSAFFYVMKTLGYPWRLLTIFQFIPRVLRDWLYDRIALNRYVLFGKYEYCTLPSPDHESRYLDGK